MIVFLKRCLLTSLTWSFYLMLAHLHGWGAVVELRGHLCWWTATVNQHRAEARTPRRALARAFRRAVWDGLFDEANPKLRRGR